MLLKYCNNNETLHIRNTNETNQVMEKTNATHEIIRTEMTRKQKRDSADINVISANTQQQQQKRTRIMIFFRDENGEHNEKSSLQN